MDAINWHEFVNYMEKLLDDLKSFSIADVLALLMQNMGCQLVQR
ncbi:hypothetical protein RG835_01480 (plasmid) [Enterococcus faecium]